MQWLDAVFEGDLECWLVPHQGVPMIVHHPGRKRLEQQRAQLQVDQESERTRLHDRVREPKSVTEALGNAIGFLHQMSKQEPAVIRGIVELNVSDENVNLRSSVTPRRFTTTARTQFRSQVQTTAELPKLQGRSC